MQTDCAKCGDLKKNGQWVINSADMRSRLIVSEMAGGCKIMAVNCDGEFIEFKMSDDKEHQLIAAVFQALRFEGPFGWKKKEQNGWYPMTSSEDQNICFGCGHDEHSHAEHSDQNRINADAKEFCTGKKSVSGAVVSCSCRLFVPEAN